MERERKEGQSSSFYPPFNYGFSSFRGPRLAVVTQSPNLIFCGLTPGMDSLTATKMGKFKRISLCTLQNIFLYIVWRPTFLIGQVHVTFFFLPSPRPPHLARRGHPGAVGQLIPHAPKTSISASQTQSNSPSNLAKSLSRLPTAILQ